ncbi:Gfo/Idh/MocA family oxidoreductase [Microbacterium sp. QXD-8]|uniref:Gfo/Idh/MocA family oxidoreductase n=1 Tax=Microbacterium psychrotolerans TaxID=3068321 RepID=A0ABU0Z4U8_9MICO|nr:Gfo/Idh/MocA family oxidoreductase [Microbacterium sp. QXD-8]MDQ7879621.1 Gfo/Idh/MocA family oxidoreductase [Microbacterium sp. QXD-8]
MTTEVIDIVVGTVRTGLIGGGFMGRVHAAAARRAGARLTAVASSSRDRAEAVAQELGVARAEADAAAVFSASDIDVVHICTPNATHAPLAAAALAAGKHVVCEKPLATSVTDARALVRAADEAGVVAAVPFVYRYHPMVREARARVASGRIGTLLTLDGSYLQDWMLRENDDDWRADAAAGGPSRAFADIGSHLCDLVEFVTGERIARLAARTRRVFDERGGRRVLNEDVAALLIETESGALGTLLVSQMAPGRKNALVIELHGSRRSIRFAQERPEELWVGARKASRLVLRDPATASPDSARLQPLPAGHPMGYQDAFDGFVGDVYAAIAGEQPDGLPTFADGLRAAVVTDAVLESAERRSWIEVPS